MQAKINGVRIGYDDFGQGPAVLFIHDYPVNRQMWQAQVTPLVEAGFRVVLTDLRGFGESQLTEGPVSLATYSADIIGLLDYLGIGRAAACGLSLGGYVLFDLLEHYPQRIVGACLASSRPVADDVHERAKRAELLAALENGQLEAIKKEFGKVLLPGQDEDYPESLKEDVLRWLQELKSAPLAAVLQAIGQRKDYTFLLRSLKIPMLLVGVKRDPATHQRHTDIMAQHLPNCFRAVKMNTGRLANLENPREFNQHLLEFLQRLAPLKQPGFAEMLRSVG